MKLFSLLLISLLLPLSSWGACVLDEESIRNDLFTNVRSLFELSDDTLISKVDRIKVKDLEEDANVAMLQPLSEDRFFDSPRPKVKNPCPDRIIRVYRFYSQDTFRKCNGVMKTEVLEGTYVVLYRNCGRN
jgi:hypothetical protein